MSPLFYVALLLLVHPPTWPRSFFIFFVFLHSSVFNKLVLAVPFMNYFLFSSLNFLPLRFNSAPVDVMGLIGFSSIVSLSFLSGVSRGCGRYSARERDLTELRERGGARAACLSRFDGFRQTTRLESETRDGGGPAFSCLYFILVRHILR